VVGPFCSVFKTHVAHWLVTKFVFANWTSQNAFSSGEAIFTTCEPLADRKENNFQQGLKKCLRVYLSIGTKEFTVICMFTIS
jgi:hypothetical protein